MTIRLTRALIAAALLAAAAAIAPAAGWAQQCQKCCVCPAGSGTQSFEELLNTPGALERLQSPNALRDVAATSIGSQFLCNRRPICKCCNQLKDDADRLQIGSFSLTYFAARNGAEFDLTPEQIYEALRAGSTARVWADVDPALPRTAIRFYAPGAGALETEIFKQLTVRQGCEAVTGAPCGEIALRADGAYVEADDDAALAARLLADPTAIGVGDFSERGRFESRGLRSLAPAQEPGAFELLIESR